MLLSLTHHFFISSFLMHFFKFDLPNNPLNTDIKHPTCNEETDNSESNVILFIFWILM